MERLHLGNLVSARKTLTWREAKSQGILKGSWVVRYIFLPQRFPHGALVIENEEGIRVKKSVDADTIRNVIRFLKLSKTKITQIKALLVFSDTGEYYLEKQQADEGYAFGYNGKYFAYRKIEELDSIADYF
ncbi:MAG: hypothetical protein QXT86_13585 [Archaeoglobaceae archaeon]